MAGNGARPPGGTAITTIEEADTWLTKALGAPLYSGWWLMKRRRMRPVRSLREMGYHQRRRWTTATRVGIYTVSTVFLGLDHGRWEPGPPVLFETMIFGPDNADMWCDRYHTVGQAESGHEQVVHWVRRLLHGRPRTSCGDFYLRRFTPSWRKRCPAFPWPALGRRVDYSNRARGQRWQSRTRFRRRMARLNRSMERMRAREDQRDAARR